MNEPQSHDADCVIIGGGLAGLSSALRLADAGRDVIVVSKTELTDGSSIYAQGGIAAVLDDGDSFESHIDDTLVAGAGLCHRDAVEFVVRNAPAAIRWLIDSGVHFTTYDDEDGRLAMHLTREGGHSHRRIVHAADATGRAVETTLEGIVRRHPRIRVFEQMLAIDLILSHKIDGGPREQTRCLGVYVQNRQSNQIIAITGRDTILATGGASRVYLYTSNPDTSTGDGIAMAWRAGCRIANMEFTQFHPTCLYHPDARNFLISEALRGEGALLTRPDGVRFMPQHHDLAELAPRDIVARAIDYEIKKHGLDAVHLDISHKGDEFIREHFPTISATCKEFGFDLTTDPLPVVPAAHYSCGGIVTDLSGRTDIGSLYAVGECTCTGLHGANRLASNSLLECMVFGFAAADNILTSEPAARLPLSNVPHWDSSQVVDPDERVVIAHNWQELRRTMWDYVGIVRSDRRLQRALNRIELLKGEIDEYYASYQVHPNLIEMRNVLDVAEIIVRSAMKRHESRGLHYSIDHPERDDQAADTVLNRYH
ncbi:L-aspartate oxidase [Gammaproteobacteria bacterium]|nr:L-aspartate oxidase [Gammaproteobacteria bacterium]